MTDAGRQIQGLTNITWLLRLITVTRTDTFFVRYSLGVFSINGCNVNSSTATWKRISWSRGTQKGSRFCNWALHNDLTGGKAWDLVWGQLIKCQSFVPLPEIAGITVHADTPRGALQVSHGVIWFHSETMFCPWKHIPKSDVTWIFQLALGNKSPGPEEHINAAGSAIGLLMILWKGSKFQILGSLTDETSKFSSCSRHYRLES